MTKTPFPLFLRITDGNSVYRILSETSFTEVQRIGQRYVIHQVEALTWPERLRIADMLANHDGSLMAIPEEEFNAWSRRAENR